MLQKDCIWNLVLSIRMVPARGIVQHCHSRDKLNKNVLSNRRRTFK